jgi:hypothetical protein
MHSKRKRPKKHLWWSNVGIAGFASRRGSGYQIIRGGSPLGKEIILGEKYLNLIKW